MIFICYWRCSWALETLYKCPTVWANTPEMLGLASPEGLSVLAWPVPVTRHPFSWELPVLTWLWIFESSSLSQAEVHPSLKIQPCATWKSQSDLDLEGLSNLFSSKNKCTWDLGPDRELHTFLCRVMAFLQFVGPGACVLSGFSPATLWTIYIACQGPMC